MTQNKKCLPGCTCGRHRSRACAPGCTCKRHGSAWNTGLKCPGGCTCGLHSPPQRSKRSKEEQREADRVLQQQRRAANPEKHREASRRWVEKNPYWVKYRMTQADWDKLFESQKGRCYLCDDVLECDVRRAVHVDHDHSCCGNTRTCGTCVRGLACGDCNEGIGQFHDDPDLIRRVAANLEAAQERGVTT